MMLFGTPEFGVEILQSELDYSVVVCCGSANLIAALDIFDVTHSVDPWGVEEVRLLGRDDRYLSIEFYLDRVEFSSGILLLEFFLTPEQLGELKKNLLIFAKKITKENKK